MAALPTKNIQLNSNEDIDLYLGEPSGFNINDLPFTVKTPQLQQKYNSFLSQYGKFWLYSSNQGPILYYRQPNGIDVLVNQLTVGHGFNNHIIVRVNGQVIPTLALEQLRILLNRFNVAPYETNLLEKINIHRNALQKART